MCCLPRAAREGLPGMEASSSQPEGSHGVHAMGRPRGEPSRQREQQEQRPRGAASQGQEDATVMGGNEQEGEQWGVRSKRCWGQTLQGLLARTLEFLLGDSK